MHKQLLNEAVIELTITPKGPILIKSGDEPADPTRPDMSFVRTTHRGRESVYLPGSSLKGVLRSHCERLARTAVSRPEDQPARLACDPLDPKHSCGTYLDNKERKKWSGAEKHRQSCFLCQLFGNTSLASHLRISDAYPTGECIIEERNGVAIDRVSGSVAGRGLFNYETVTSGGFATAIYVKNFTLGQLGLLFLAIRDLEAGRVRLGFGKSRGLGVVTARVDRLALRYPLCELDGGMMRFLDGRTLDTARLFGVGSLIDAPEYGYPKPDEMQMPSGYDYDTDGWLGVEVRAPACEGGGADWQPLGRACASLWKAVVENVNRE